MPGNSETETLRERWLRQQHEWQEYVRSWKPGVSKPLLCNNCQERPMRSTTENVCGNCWQGNGPTVPVVMPSSIEERQVA